MVPLPGECAKPPFLSTGRRKTQKSPRYRLIDWWKARCTLRERDCLLRDGYCQRPERFWHCRDDKRNCRDVNCRNPEAHCQLRDGHCHLPERFWHCQDYNCRCRDGKCQRPEAHLRCRDWQEYSQKNDEINDEVLLLSFLSWEISLGTMAIVQKGS